MLLPEDCRHIHRLCNINVPVGVYITVIHITVSCESSHLKELQDR